MTVLVKSSLLLCFVVVSLLLVRNVDCLRFHQENFKYEEVPSSAVKLLSRKLQVLAAGKATVQESIEKVTLAKSSTPDEKILPDKLEWKKASAAAAVANADLGRGQTLQQKRMDNGGDSTEFFTMDYSKVRRRRPIHNKSLPVGP